MNDNLMRLQKESATRLWVCTNRKYNFVDSHISAGQVRLGFGGVGCATAGHNRSNPSESIENCGPTLSLNEAILL